MKDTTIEPNENCSECGTDLVISENGSVAECPGCGYTEA